MSSGKLGPPAESYLRRLSPASQKSVARLLDLAATALKGVPVKSQDFEWVSLTGDDIRRLREALAGQYAVATVNATLTAVRGVLREACREGLVSAAAYFDVTRVAGPPRERSVVSPDLEPTEVRSLIEKCGLRKSLMSARDTALLTILYATGMDSAAIVGLDLGDLDVETDILTSRGREGNVQYRLGDTLARLRPWLKERGSHQPGPLLWGVNKAGNLVERRLSSQVVHDVVAKRAEEAQLRGASVSAIRRAANRERLRNRLNGWVDRDEHGRVCCLPI